MIKKKERSPAKEYLQKVYSLDGYIWSLIEQRERLIDQKNKCTSILSSEPAATGISDRISNITAAEMDLVTLIDETVKEQRELKAEVLKKINGLSVVEHKTVLVHRYINFKNWFEIERIMHYSRAQIHRLHAKALVEFQDKYFNETK